MGGWSGGVGGGVSGGGVGGWSGGVAAEWIVPAEVLEVNLCACTDIATCCCCMSLQGSHHVLQQCRARVQCR